MKLRFIIYPFILVLSGCAGVGYKNTSEAGVPWKSAPTGPLVLSDKRASIPKSQSSYLLENVDLDLPLLVDLAFENNPTTRRMWHLAKAADARRGEAKSALLPTVNVNASISKQRLETKPDVGPKSLDCSTGVVFPSIELTYMIFNFGATKDTVRASEHLLQAANLQYNRSLQELLYRVQRCYFDFIAARENAEAHRANLKDAEESCKLAEIRWQTGLGNRQNYLQAKASMLQARYDFEASTSLVETTKAALATVTGIPMRENLRIASYQFPAQLPQLEAKVEDLVAQALKSRPDILASYSKLRAHDFQLKATRKNRYPQLIGTLDGGYAERFNRVKTPSISAAIGFSWNAFSGYKRAYQILEERANQAVAREELKSSELQAINEVWGSYFAYRSAEKQLISARALLEATTEAFNATQTAYSNGLGNILDLLKAQYDLATARKNLVAAENALSTKLAELAYVTGTGERPIIQENQ